MQIPDNPIETVGTFSNYVMRNFTSFPEHLQTSALSINTERSPVVTIVRGMELLYAVSRDESFEGDEEPLYETLGAVAYHVMENDFWAKASRASDMYKIARFKLGELTKEPTYPDIDPEFTPPAPETPASPPM